MKIDSVEHDVGSLTPRRRLRQTITEQHVKLSNKVDTNGFARFRVLLDSPNRDLMITNLLIKGHE